jgi:hypothetical protein
VRGNQGESILEPTLTYSSEQGQILIEGYNDVDRLKGVKDILLALTSKWRKEGGRFIVAGE